MEPLVTITDLNAKRWWFVKPVALSIIAGLAAFGITWIALSWPTVVAELTWYSGNHPAAVVVSNNPNQGVPAITTNHLVIKGINVEAPITYDSDITDAAQALPNGVVHVKGTAYPGEIGNTFIIGHSSGYWWQQGAYNQVFVLLDKLKPNDQVLINRNGTTYEYRVTSSEVVPPAAVQVLDQPTDRSALSLMTCTPVGTSKNRLIVHAEYVRSDQVVTALGNYLTALRAN